MSQPGRQWWRNAVVYEVYLRGFADGNADGQGDLPGLTARLDYLAELGVDALWIAPWYPSPLVDGGYDVVDYRDIHMLFGTLGDAEEMIEAAHQRRIRIIIDLVANHTSAEHPWFRAALAAPPGSPQRRRYFFRDGRGADGQVPPNNWISAFGGSAWTRVVGTDGRAGQWYLHTFDAQQPDLAWGREEVRAEFDDILRFWLDRGVDGFRIDAVPAMGKVPGLPDAHYGEDLRFTSAEWVDNPHWDVDSVHDILRRWRRILDSYAGERMFVAEAVVNGPDRLARYLRSDEVHTAFNFDYLRVPWDAEELRRVIDRTIEALEPVGAPATWVLSNHDEIRHVTRLGREPGSNPDLGTRRARAALLLTLALPGGVYLYQGEELGLPEVDDLPDHVLRDPVHSRSGGMVRGRDGCRVPLPWSGDQPPFGFSPPGTPTWLPQPPDWASLTVRAQTGDRNSMLELYRRALSLRRQLEGVTSDDLTWLAPPGPVLDFQRGPGFRCVVNLGQQTYPLASEPDITSAPLDEGFRLPPDTAIWILDLPAGGPWGHGAGSTAKSPQAIIIGSSDPSAGAS